MADNDDSTDSETIREDYTKDIYDFYQFLVNDQMHTKRDTVDYEEISAINFPILEALLLDHHNGSFTMLLTYDNQIATVSFKFKFEYFSNTSINGNIRKGIAFTIFDEDEQYQEYSREVVFNDDDDFGDMGCLIDFIDGYLPARITEKALELYLYACTRIITESDTEWIRKLFNVY